MDLLKDEWLKQARNSMDYVNEVDKEVNKKIDNLVKLMFLITPIGITLWGVNPPNTGWYWSIGILMCILVYMFRGLLKSQEYSVVNTMEELTDLYENNPESEEYSYWLLIYAINRNIISTNNVIKKRSNSYDTTLLIIMITIIAFALSIIV